MNDIKLIFEKTSFRFVHIESIGLFVLGHFLVSDVWDSFQIFIDWLLDPTQTITGSNATDLEKRGDMVFIKDTLEEGPYFGYRFLILYNRLKIGIK